MYAFVHRGKTFSQQNCVCFSYRHGTALPFARYCGILYRSIRKKEETGMEINGTEVQELFYYRDMGLSEETMKALDKKGYEKATAIQGGAIPCFMDWKDVNFNLSIANAGYLQYSKIQIPSDASKTFTSDGYSIVIYDQVNYAYAYNGYNFESWVCNSVTSSHILPYSLNNIVYVLTE